MPTTAHTTRLCSLFRFPFSSSVCTIFKRPSWVSQIDEYSTMFLQRRNILHPRPNDHAIRPPLQPYLGADVSRHFCVLRHYLNRHSSRRRRQRIQSRIKRSTGRYRARNTHHDGRYHYPTRLDECFRTALAYLPLACSSSADLEGIVGGNHVLGFLHHRP